ncbi:hypothetical protein ACNKHW_20135 [Shigella flexneri]
MYSALKHQGRPLYEYARKGITIERKPARIRCMNCCLSAMKGSELELEIHCSKGTYIRTIIDDLVKNWLRAHVDHAAPSCRWPRIRQNGW